MFSLYLVLIREFELWSPTPLTTSGSSHILDHLGAIFRNLSCEKLCVFLSGGTKKMIFMYSFCVCTGRDVAQPHQRKARKGCCASGKVDPSQILERR